jgi:branched-chain amino acid transport system substrate-binding protein
MRRLLPLVAAITLAGCVPALSGCGAADTVLQRVRGDADQQPAVASIAVLAPLTGGDTRVGEGVVAAVEQAVADSGGVPGWQVQVEAVDLTSPDLPDLLEEMDDSDSLVAVVTGFAAADVRSTVPVLDEAGLAIVSPADSDPRHLRGADPAAPLRPWTGYASIAVDPTPERSALADHLVRAVGATSIVVVTDGSADAASRATELATEVTERGSVPVTVLAGSGAVPTPEVTAAVAALGATAAVVVDGPADLAAAVAATTPAAVALTTRADSLTPEQAQALEGAVTPDAGLDPRRGSAELDARLQASGSATSGGGYGPAAYDAGRLLVDALTRCLPDPTAGTGPTRSACRAEVAATQWAGLTGAVVLDEFGGRLGLLPGILTLRAGQWALPGQ